MPKFAFPSLAILFCLCCSVVPLAAQTITGENIGERDPFLTADGSYLFFSRPDFARNQGSKNLSDIWIRQLGADGRWGRALNPGSPINSFGADRPVGLSTDGNRIAVLREGPLPTVDVLERNGRTWNIRNSISLPTELRAVTDLTFNPQTYTLIYASGGDQSELYLLRVDGRGEWTAPSPLHLLNTEVAESRPTFASDNRTLYYRSGDDWFRQTDRSVPASRVATPGGTEQLATALFGPVTAVVSTGRTLSVAALDPTDLPPPAQLTRGFISGSLAPGEPFTTLPVSNERSLRVFPDQQRRYAIFLREGEGLFTEDSRLTTPLSTTPSGGLASTTEAPRVDARQLETDIAYQERALRRLDSLRRATSSGYVGQPDPERDALTRRLHDLNEMNGDTLPPRSRNKSGQTNSTRARYADDISELERMKAKFRRQQDDKMSGRSAEKWSSRGADPAPSTGRSYTPPPTAEEREAARLDSLRLQSEINNGFYNDRRTGGNGSWERDLQRDLPRSNDITPEERARLDADYNRQMEELEAMRRQLRQARNEPEPAPSTTAPRQWEARSPAPSTYSAPARRRQTTSEPVSGSTSGYRSSASAGMPAGITFIPSTAYPNGAGYDALDQLSRLVQNSGTVVEVRVHTSVNLDRRTAQLLSEERAITIRNYLIEQGINAANFSVIGYGNNLTGNGGERVELFR